MAIILVVFPDPVSAITIRQEYYSIQYNISFSKKLNSLKLLLEIIGSIL